MNQLGAIESGVVAAVANATFAVVGGGVGPLAVVATSAATLPRLRRHRMPRPGEAPKTPAAATPAGAAEASLGGSREQQLYITNEC